MINFSCDKLDDLVVNAGIVDRFVRSPFGIQEAVVTMSVRTDKNGRVVYVLSVDMVKTDDDTMLSYVLCEYDMSSRSVCATDARRLASHWCLTLRLLQTCGNWMYEPIGGRPVDGRSHRPAPEF